MTVKLTTHHLLNYFQVGACRWRVGKTSATSDVTIHTYTFLETFFPNLRGSFKKKWPWQYLGRVEDKRSSLWSQQCFFRSILTNKDNSKKACPAHLTLSGSCNSHSHPMRMRVIFSFSNKEIEVQRLWPGQHQTSAQVFTCLNLGTGRFLLGTDNQYKSSPCIQGTLPSTAWGKFSLPRFPFLTLTGTWFVLEITS